MQVALLPPVAAELTGSPYYHGMLAFALEQNGDSAGAEAHGRKGTDIVPDDAWSHHAVAHALYNKASEMVERVSCCRCADHYCRVGICFCDSWALWNCRLVIPGSC